jgi:transcriptional regulator with XRE-family HTH domain
MLVIDCSIIGIICQYSVSSTASSKIRKSFGKRVRELRRDQDYSQESFADDVGLHRTYIGSIERGEQNVSLDNIAKLAKTLGISISTLFKGL